MIEDAGDPLGTDAASIWGRKVMRFIRRYAVLQINGALRKPQAGGGVIYEIQFPTIPPAGVNGWHFSDKIEADPTREYGAQTVIHVQESNTLVTAGIRDAANPAGPLILSKPGYWVSTQPVPAKKTVSGNDVWNLPQYPLPFPADLDNEANFWIYLGEIYCA